MNVGQRVKIPQQKSQSLYSAYRVKHLPTPTTVGTDRNNSSWELFWRPRSAPGFWAGLFILCSFGRCICVQRANSYPVKWWPLAVPLYYSACLVVWIKGRLWNHRRLVFQSEIKQRAGHPTFSYLANPVVKMFTVNVIPGHTRITF